MDFLPVEDQLLHLKRGVEEIIPEEELRTKLRRAAQHGKTTGC